MDEQRLANALVTTASGQRIALSELATLELVDGPSAISREWAKRRIVVQANVRGRDVGGFVAEARTRIHERVEPPARMVRALGRAVRKLRTRARATRDRGAGGARADPLSLLWLSFRRVTDVARIFAAVPFARWSAAWRRWRCAGCRSASRRRSGSSRSRAWPCSTRS